MCFFRDAQKLAPLPRGNDARQTPGRRIKTVADGESPRVKVLMDLLTSRGQIIPHLQRQIADRAAMLDLAVSGTRGFAVESRCPGGLRWIVR